MTDLLDDVPHVMFCAKDESGAYLTVNQAFADRAGARNPDDVVGRPAEDLFDGELAASYTPGRRAVGIAPVVAQPASS